MINPIPLYLDKDDIIKLRSYLNSLYYEIHDNDVLIISQNSDLNKIYLSIWNEGSCYNQIEI